MRMTLLCLEITRKLWSHSFDLIIIYWNLMQIKILHFVITFSYSIKWPFSLSTTVLYVILGLLKLRPSISVLALTMLPTCKASKLMSFIRSVSGEFKLLLVRWHLPKMIHNFSWLVLICTYFIFLSSAIVITIIFSSSSNFINCT